jgi:hypothetical protein
MKSYILAILILAIFTPLYASSPALSQLEEAGLNKVKVEEVGREQGIWYAVIVVDETAPDFDLLLVSNSRVPLVRSECLPGQKVRVKLPDPPSPSAIQFQAFKNDKPVFVTSADVWGKER